MGKIVFVFLIVCFFSAFTSASDYDHHSDYSLNFSTEIFKDENVELYVAIASGVFDFVAKFIRANLDIFLWIKKIIIQLLIRGLAHLRVTLLHNSSFVSGFISVIAELARMLLTNRPHFAVPHIQKIITQAEHDYLPYTHY